MADAATGSGAQSPWRRPLYWRAAIAAVLTSVFALASSIFSMIVYDRVIPNNALGSLYALLFGVGIIFLSDFVIRSLRAYFLDVAGSRADTEIADAVFDHVLDLDMRARRGPTGSLSNILKEYETLRDFFTSSTLTTMIDIPFASCSSSRCISSADRWPGCRWCLSS